MQKKKRFSQMKSRNRILLVVGICMAMFVVYTVAFYSIKGWQWDAIFPYVLGVGGIEGVMTAMVAVADKVTTRTKRKEKDNYEI